MRFLILFLPLIVQASDLYRLPDYNWRASPGEVFINFKNSYSIGGITMSVPSVISSDVDIFKSVISNTIKIGVSERLDLAIATAYSFIEESTGPSSKEVIRGIHSPAVTMSYLLVEEYPAFFGSTFTFSLAPKIGEAVDELDSSDKKVGGNMLSPSTAIGSILKVNKALSDYWQISVDLSWKHTFEGEKIKRKLGVDGISKIDPVDLIGLSFLTKHLLTEGHYLEVSFQFVHLFELTSTSPLGIENIVESNNAFVVGFNYGYEIDDKTYLELGGSVLVQSDYSLGSSILMIDVSDTVVFGLTIGCSFLI